MYQNDKSKAERGLDLKFQKDNDAYKKITCILL